MCGFVASSADKRNRLGNTESGVDQLTHRGPDERGTWNHDHRSVSLSQCRLSIIDPPGGHQPMQSDGSVLVYNGELYNHAKLRNQLKTRGYSFRTDSDTEVFLKGYLEWGFDFFDKVRGMFAAVIWDDEESQLVLVRDHVGQKPLFYHNGDDSFAAASEIQGLLGAKDISRKVDPASISWYLSLGYVPNPRSAFKEIKKLPPGHYMIVSDNKIKTQVRYWNPVEKSRNSTGEITSPSKIRDRLRTAVDRRMISDVPLGAFLSGGIDSSIIVSLMSDLSDDRVSTISVGFSDDEYDERTHARTVADHLKTDHHSFKVSLELPEVLPELARHFGEPFADSSAVPTYYLSRKTSDIVTVALSGDGGDELFGGYRRYRALNYLSMIKSFVPEFLLNTLQNLAHLLPDYADRRSRTAELIRVLRFVGENSVSQYNEMVGLGYDSLKSKLSQSGLKKPGKRGGEQWLARWFKRFDHVNNPAQQAMLVDLMSYLPGDLLVKSDISTMMNSLECRSPFLDRDVIEMSMNVPVDMKIDGNNQKACLKRAFKDDLPDEILGRSKQGFGVPLASWFRNSPEVDYLRSILLNDDSPLDPLLNRGEVKSLADEHYENETDSGPILWALTMLELWAREFEIRI